MSEYGVRIADASEVLNDERQFTTNFADMQTLIYEIRNRYRGLRCREGCLTSVASWMYPLHMLYPTSWPRGPLLPGQNAMHLSHPAELLYGRQSPDMLLAAAAPQRPIA